jgi:hypothetical protein
VPLTSRTKVNAELLGSLGWRAPFQYQFDMPAGVADVYEVPVASGVVNQALAFPTGLVTITTLWLTADRDVSVVIGPVASNQAKLVKAHGVIGFTGASLPVANAVSVSYSAADGQPATLLVYVAGT